MPGAKVLATLVSSLALLLALAAPPVSGDAPVHELTLRGPNGEQVVVPVELALTAAQRERGLMHRKALAREAGMLFDFEREQGVAMWMKNTLIPLDMLFARADGSVVAIIRETTPGSLKPLGPKEPVRYVLEVNGGFADRHGIGAGWRLTALP